MESRRIVCRGPRLVGAVAVAVLCSVLLARSAGAQVDQTLRADLDALIVDIGTAAGAVLAGNTDAAAATLGDAEALLTQIAALVRDPAAAQELGALARRLGAQLRALQRLVDRARAAVGNPAMPPNRRVRAVRAAYARASSIGALAGKPILVETNSRSAGFHRPGDQVTFRVLGPNGGPCNEAPVVTVENQFGATAVDLTSIHVLADGSIALTMGDDAGGARVTVTACGQSSTRLLFNYGPKAVNGLPAGFPAALPGGTYQLSYSANGVVDIGETPLATIPNVAVRVFARTLLTVFRQVAAAYASPNCATGIRYSRFDGNEFTATYSITCTVDQATASETIVFHVRRL